MYKTLKEEPKIKYNNAFIWYERGLYIPKISLYNTFPLRISSGKYASLPQSANKSPYTRPKNNADIMNIIVNVKTAIISFL